MTSTYGIWPLRFSPRPAAMIGFAAALGLRLEERGDGGTFASFAGRGGRFGVHDAATAAAGPTTTRTTLNFVTPDLATAADELNAAGLAVQVWDEPFGPQGVVVTPGGLVIGLLGDDRDPTERAGWGEQSVAASMDVVAICTVADVEREADFFGRFGFAALEPGQGYLPLTAGPDAGVLGLRSGAGPASVAAGSDRFGPPYLVQLGTETSEPFDAFAGRLAADGYEAETVEDDSGIWIRVVDPDGMPLEVRPTR